jgi:tripartite-type tricarboxylate transporter receptor subunit TctC
VSRMLLALAALVCALMAPADAQESAKDYPNRPIRLVVPYAAGGGTDALARYLARGMEQRLGQPVIVENRAGSGTATGGAFVAKAASDGYTLLIATSSTVAINATLYKNLPYDPAVDFSPISMVAAIPFVLVVHPDLGVDDLAGLVALAKAKPGALSYASGGIGAPHHVFMELLKSMVGIDLKHIPYRGGGPALTDVVAGHVPVMFADAGPALEQVRGGRVKALGVTTVKRVETMPSVPTLNEAGVTGYEANSWQCIVAPANLPAPIVARLNAALVDLMQAPETKAHFVSLGMQPLWSTPAENAAYITSEIARWAKVIKTIGAIDN